MPRHRSLRPALVAAAVALAGLGAVPGGSSEAGGAPAAPPDEASPLSVTIESLTPGAIPRSGPIRVTGSVTNRDDETWTTINLYPFVGSTPMTTAADLAEASQVPAEEYVGDRVTAAGDTVDELAPGQSAQFRITLPRALVAAEAGGVYWFGVHALGASSAGRDDVSDGRARTFLPLVPRGTRGRVETALVIPLRRALTREPDGSVADVGSWTRDLGTDGTLRSLVDLGAAAGDRPVTWLVDPALVDMVDHLADGNPPRSLEPTVEAEPVAPSGPPDAGSSPGEDASPTTGSDGGGGDDSAAPGHEPTAEEVEAAAVATTWLARLSGAMRSDEVLALPYGDLDVAAATAVAPDLVERARARSARATSAWQASVAPTVGSPSGFLAPDSVRALDREETILVTDRMLGEEPPGVATAYGRRLVVTSAGAASGGPGPDDPLGNVALRQRILAEAAVRLISPGRRPLVVQLPSGWSPGSSTGFFAGLDQAWVELTTVADVADRQGTPVEPDDLAYPPRQERLELEAESFAAAEELIGTGEVLQHVLRDNAGIAAEAADEALGSLSYSARARPTSTRLAVEASTRWIEEQLGSITIDAPRGVALSSANGRFGATITNGLEEPVEVSIEALTDDPSAISIEGPQTVEVPAGGRTSVLLDATTRKPGVHKVTLVLTDHTEDPDDRHTPIGSTDELPIRSIQATAVIWVIMGAGALLLLGAVVVRLVRRVRTARREEATG